MPPYTWPVAWKDFGLVEGSLERRVCRLHPSHATTRFAVELGKAEGPHRPPKSWMRLGSKSWAWMRPLRRRCYGRPRARRASSTTGAFSPLDR